MLVIDTVEYCDKHTPWIKKSYWTRKMQMSVSLVVGPSEASSSDQGAQQDMK